MTKLERDSKIVSSMMGIVFGILLLGFSYAFFVYNKEGLYTHTINGGKMKVIYEETSGNNITIENAYPRTDNEALTKGLEFEFTVTGYNESEKNVYYAIEIDHGEDVQNKNRFRDTDIKLTLIENNELVFENQIFENLDNQDIHYGYISYGTSDEIPTINTYKMRLWINDNVYISDTVENDISLWDDEDWNWIDSIYGSVDATDEAIYNACPDFYDGYSDECSLSDLGISVYTSDEFANSYANFRVNVKADLTYDNIGYLTYDANGGKYTPKKTSLSTNMITMQKPVKLGNGFLGWSSDKNATIPEYYPGDHYTGGEQILYAVYSEKMNVMNTFSETIKNEGSKISQIHFISEEQSIIDEAYEAATIKDDLTHEEQGSVKAWLESDPNNEGMNILYVGSEGTTYVLDGYRLFYGFTDVQEINMANIDTSMITNMEGMFFLGTIEVSCSGTSIVNNTLQILDLRVLNTSKVTNMRGMFAGLSGVAKFSSIDVSNFDTSNVEDMSYMFNSLYFPENTTLDLISFDTSNVTNMSYMFSEIGNVDLILSNFDTSQVIDMSFMFAWYGGEFLNLESFITDKVTNMCRMFYVCDSLNELNLSNFNTSKVTNMECMFSGCSSLTNLDLSNFDTGRVSTMWSMFNGCRNLFNINLSNFDTSNVTDMSAMFSGCENLTEIDLSSFDTSQVTTVGYMFNECSNLIILDLSNFMINSLKITNKMFFDCSNLITIYANVDWNESGNLTSNYYKSNEMFYGCSKLIGSISYNASKIDGTYANPDTGYFTYKYD